MQITGITVEETNNGKHPYTARCDGYSTLGFGQTRDEARTNLAQNMAHEDVESLQSADACSSICLA